MEERSYLRPTIKTDKVNVVEGQIIRFFLCNLEEINNKDTIVITISYDAATQGGNNISTRFNLSLQKEGVDYSGELFTSGLAKGNYIAAYHDNECAAKFSIMAPKTTSNTTTLNLASKYPTNDQSLWDAIRNHAHAIGFARYKRFMDTIFGCKDQNSSATNIQSPNAYTLLKLATQVFLTLESGVVVRDGELAGHKLSAPIPDSYLSQGFTVTEEKMQARLKQFLSNSVGNEILPYLDTFLNTFLALSPLKVTYYYHGILQYRYTWPILIELIWSYWEEQGMLVQTMNAISLRYKNQRSSLKDNPLANIEIDPLRPLNNLLWGYIRDEIHRVSIDRRYFEYNLKYGLKLTGLSAPELQSANSHSKFLTAFHNLLNLTVMFCRDDTDTLGASDTFPVQNALKEVHLLLAEGGHDCYGDLPCTARAEILMQQWMLARPEMRKFLHERNTVPCQEEWMGAVDAMKKLQGWTDTTITHFNELASDGELLLLSIRFGSWVELNKTENQSRKWAHYWKPEIKRYLNGYREVTGVDLIDNITAK